MQDKVQPRRRVRSYMRREGHMSASKRRTLERMSPQFVLDFCHQQLELASVFGRTPYLVVEVGFGTGHSLAQLANKNPDKDYIGIEVYKTGIAKLLTQIESLQLSNLRIICGDAIEILEHMIPQDCLNEFLLYFPDPWPKTKHHKRRLVNPEFCRMLMPKLRSESVIHMATDWEEYASQMLNVLDNETALENKAGNGQFSFDKRGRTMTKFEQKGLNRGHLVWDLVFFRKSK